MTRAAVLSFIAFFTLLASPRTALAGVAGPYPSLGYYVALAAAVAVGGGLFVYFRRR